MAKLLDIGIFSIVDTDSSLGVGWKLNFYVSGTSTRLDTYPTKTDADNATNANSNPVVVSTDARLPPIWLTEAAKCILTDENDVVKETIDPVITFTPSYETVHHTYIGNPDSSQFMGGVIVKSDLLFPPDFVGAVASIKSLPAANYVVDMQIDGDSIGSVTFDTSGNALIESIGGLETEVAADSQIDFYAPLVTDTARDFTFVLIGQIVE